LQDCEGSAHSIQAMAECAGGAAAFSIPLIAEKHIGLLTSKNNMGVIANRKQAIRYGL
jgi:hypothetical protein